MDKRHRIPKFNNLDEEIEFYANIDQHIPMRELTLQEKVELDKLLSIRHRKELVVKTKATRKASYSPIPHAKPADCGTVLALNPPGPPCTT